MCVCMFTERERGRERLVTNIVPSYSPCCAAYHAKYE